MKQYQLKAERLHLTSSRRSYRSVVIFAATVGPQKPKERHNFLAKQQQKMSAKKVQTLRTGDLGSPRTSSLNPQASTHPGRHINRQLSNGEKCLIGQFEWRAGQDRKCVTSAIPRR